MIEKLIVKGFRKLRDFSWEPNKGVNILVGDNSAGKSTILDALELVMSCRMHGRPARSELSPYWFNQQDVESFFDDIQKADKSSIRIPTILIEAYFDNSTSGEIAGVNNSQTIDSPGLALSIKIDPNLEVEFLNLCKSDNHSSKSIPVEYFKLEWKTFKGDSILRTPKYVSCSRIDSLPRTSLRAIDSYARNAIDETLSDEQVRRVSNKYRDLRQEIDQTLLSEIDGDLELPDQLGSMGFKMDQSPKSDWRNSVVVNYDNVPLPYAGKGNEVITRAHISLQKSLGRKVLLVEEPESHLSHTSLFKLLGLLEDELGTRQMFVSTHSPFVLNRLGLDKLALIVDGRSPVSLTSLSKSTVRYFQRLSGYDTLRIVLARKLVLVEGPSDEMIFKWAYEKRYGHYPEYDSIDVMEYGTRGKRALELAYALDRGKVAVLRDNDGESPNHWIEEASDFIKEGKRQMFVGEPGEGRTLEPQMVSANKLMGNHLASIVGAPTTNPESLAYFMEKHKTEWALKLLLAEEESPKLTAPRYIDDAIDFIASEPEEAE